MAHCSTWTLLCRGYLHLSIVLYLRPCNNSQCNKQSHPDCHDQSVNAFISNFVPVNCIGSICTKFDTNSLCTNLVHSISQKNWTFSRKIGCVIQIVVDQFVHKQSPKKILKSEKNRSPFTFRYARIRRISTKERKKSPYKPYVHGRHVESILETCKKHD